ncbi:TetR/AcrR family transcriptional regulator, partial [Mesorhizobium sp. M8A.F.Ca.ET.021.01.1.1]
DKISADQQEGREQGTDPRQFAMVAVAAYSGAMSMAKAAQDASPLRDCLAAFESAAQAASSQGDPGARRRRRVLRRYGGI